MTIYARLVSHFGGQVKTAASLGVSRGLFLDGFPGAMA